MRNNLLGSIHGKVKAKISKRKIMGGQFILRLALCVVKIFRTRRSNYAATFAEAD